MLTCKNDMLEQFVKGVNTNGFYPAVCGPQVVARNRLVYFWLEVVQHFQVGHQIEEGKHNRGRFLQA